MGIHSRLFAASALLTVAVSGCHGGSGSPSGLIPGRLSSQAQPSGTGIATFSIAVPPGTTSMQSAKITLTQVNGLVPSSRPATVAVNLAGNAPGCATSGKFLTCYARVNAPAGKDTFTIVTYALPNGTGPEVSTSQANATIVGGRGTSCIPSGPGNSPPKTKA